MSSRLARLCRVLIPSFMRRSLLATSLRRYISVIRPYSSRYYDCVIEPAASRNAPRIAESILADLRPQSVVDVGCGTGALLAALQSRGCEVLGLENSAAALRYCRARDLRVMAFDLRRDMIVELPRFDVAVSMEVAEHLPESCAERYLRVLTGLSDSVVFTAAQPGQGGTDHVNEQLPSYWISRSETLGYEFQETLSERWRKAWREAGTVRKWYWRNLMIFRKSSH